MTCIMLQPVFNVLSYEYILGTEGLVGFGLSRLGSIAVFQFWFNDICMHMLIYSVMSHHHKILCNAHSLNQCRR